MNLLEKIFNRTCHNNDSSLWLPEFDKTQSIFIHIPKSAGTSISHSLYGKDPWHHTALAYQLANPDKFNKYFTFGFIRNPFDRLLSTYLYSFIQVKNNPSTSVRFVTLYDTFSSFIFNWVNKDNINNHYFFYPQTKYITDKRGKIIVDYIGRFESIEEDFIFICKKLGVENTLRTMNNTDHGHYRNYYDRNTRKIVENVYSDDFEYFMYNF